MKPRWQSRDVRMCFCVTPDEEKQLKDDAARRDVPVSWLIRKLIAAGRKWEKFRRWRAGRRRLMKPRLAPAAAASNGQAV